MKNNFIKLFILKITKIKIKLQGYISKKKVFLLSSIYILLLVSVLLLLTRLYILEIIELNTLTLVNPCLDKLIFGSNIGLKKISIENIYILILINKLLFNCKLFIKFILYNPILLSCFVAFLMLVENNKKNK